MKAAKAGVLSALLATACCGGPLLLLAVGLGGGGAFFGRYHWFFLVGALGGLTWAWTMYFRDRTACGCESKPLDVPKGSLITLCLATAVVLGFAGLNFGLYAFPESAGRQAKLVSSTTMPNSVRTVFSIEGMSCATCEISVRAALKRVSGVRSALVSSATNSATVEFDPRLAKPEQLAEAINSTGYRTPVPNE
ncbi:MAG: heavy-metal-associated domain-containing protein [Verrucomicrobia bacterium]|nr:heavy-metal-associated domain-containing protein [Verrucomicrobiota bacterium]